MADDRRCASDPLLTLTHARLRAGQGDLSGARRVLRGLLAASPDNARARSMLDELSPRRARARIPAEDPKAARIRRLRAWLGRVSR